MSLDALTRIRQAEEQAEEIRMQAQRQARDIVAGLEEALVGERRQSQEFIRESARQVLSNAEASAQREIAAEDKRWQARREKARAEAVSRVGEAGQRIFERIVTHGDR